MNQIIRETELLELSGLSQRSALRKALKKAGIPFKELAGVLFTTQAAIDAALVGRGNDTKKRPNLDALTAKGESSPRRVPL
jgi:predicted nucleotidyltransferase